MFLEPPVAASDEEIVGAHAYSVFDPGKIFFEVQRNGGCTATHGVIGSRRRGDVRDDTVDTIGFCMPPIVTLFETDILEDEEEGRHADGQTDDIDDGKYAMSQDIADGGGEIAFDHIRRFLFAAQRLRRIRDSGTDGL